MHNEFKALVLKDINSMDNIHIFLTRSEDQNFNPAGRLQNKDEAKALDLVIKDTMNSYFINYMNVSVDRYSLDNILNIINVNYKNTPIV